MSKNFLQVLMLALLEEVESLKSTTMEIFSTCSGIKRMPLSKQKTICFTCLSESFEFSLRGFMIQRGRPVLSYPLKYIFPVSALISTGWWWAKQRPQITEYSLTYLETNHFFIQFIWFEFSSPFDSVLQHGFGCLHNDGTMTKYNDNWRILPLSFSVLTSKSHFLARMYLWAVPSDKKPLSFG